MEIRERIEDDGSSTENVDIFSSCFVLRLTKTLRKVLTTDPYLLTLLNTRYLGIDKQQQYLPIDTDILFHVHESAPPIGFGKCGGGS